MSTAQSSLRLTAYSHGNGALEGVLRELLHLKVGVTIGRRRPPGLREAWGVCFGWLLWPGGRSQGGISPVSHALIWGVGRPFVIIERPQKAHGQRHGQDLGDADGHAQEAQRLQLLRAADEAVDLRTAALETQKRKFGSVKTVSISVSTQRLGGGGQVKGCWPKPRTRRPF